MTLRQAQETRPDFSPAMLQFFLHARAGHAASGLTGGKRFDALRRFKSETRKAAGVTGVAFQMAWTGRLPTPEPRAQLWRALGHVVTDYGVELTHGGQQGLAFDDPAALAAHLLRVLAQ